MYDYFVELQIFGARPRYTDTFDTYEEAKKVFDKARDVVDYFGGHLWLCRLDENGVVKAIDCY